MKNNDRPHTDRSDTLCQSTHDFFEVDSSDDDDDLAQSGVGNISSRKDRDSGTGRRAFEPTEGWLLGENPDCGSCSVIIDTTKSTQRRDFRSLDIRVLSFAFSCFVSR